MLTRQGRRRKDATTQVEEEIWMLGWMYLESGMRKGGRKQRRRMLPKLGLASSKGKVKEQKLPDIKTWNLARQGRNKERRDTRDAWLGFLRRTRL